MTAANRVLWSRGYAVGDVGDFDLSTRTYTIRANGAFVPDDVPATEGVYAGTTLLSVALSTTADQLTQNLVEVRADGSLPTVHTAQGFTNLRILGARCRVSRSLPALRFPVLPHRSRSVMLTRHGAAGLRRTSSPDGALPRLALG